MDLLAFAQAHPSSSRLENLDTTWAIFHRVYEQTSLTNHTHPFYAKWAGLLRIHSTIVLL